MADARPTPPPARLSDAARACPNAGTCCRACRAARRPAPVRLGGPVPEAGRPEGDAPAPLRLPTR